MSNLRIVGLLIGTLGLILTARIYRGPRWKRLNFVLSGVLSVSMIAVCLSPDLLNTISGMLSLEQKERGRILTILIFSNIALWFLLTHWKTKLDDFGHQFDLLIRNFGHEDSRQILEREIQDKQIVVIMPAYNEGHNLSGLLQNLPDRIDHMKVGVLVVDDGSSDDTYRIAKESGALVVRNRVNRGQGAASRLGYDVLTKYDVPIGVTMDADGQHRPGDIEKIVRPVLEDKYDLVIGSRVLGNREGGTALRNLGVILFTKIINMLTGVRLTDCSSGFKAFDICSMKELVLREDQFQSAEVIIEAAKKGLRIGEVPITIAPRNHGQSKKGKDLRYGYNFALSIVKAWWK